MADFKGLINTILINTGRGLYLVFEASASRGRPAAFLLLLALVALRFWDPLPIQTVRMLTFDMYQDLNPRVFKDDFRPVRIVDIDEKSLGKYGQFPWSRDLLAQMVENLTKMGAAVVSFDVVFAEPDSKSPTVYADRLTRSAPEAAEVLKRLPDNDDLFAQAMKNSRVVLGQTGHSGDLDRSRPQIKKSIATRRVLPPQSLREIMGMHVDKVMEQGGPLPSIEDMVCEVVVNAPGLTRNIDVLEKAAIGHGMFTVPDDIGGVIRRTPTLTCIVDTETGEKTIYPSLFVETLRVALGGNTVMAQLYDSNLNDNVATDSMAAIVVQSQIQGVPHLKVETGSDGRVWPYFSDYDPLKYISAVDVIEGTIKPEDVQGRIILVGTSAPGLVDIRTTPTEAALPGVEVQAQLIETALSGEYLRRPADTEGFEIVFLFVGGLLMIILVPQVGARWTLLVLFIIVDGAALLTWHMFTERATLVDTVYAVGAVFLIYTFMTYWGYASEESKREQVRKAFAFYLAPAMVDKLAEDATSLKLGGERRNMTMLFCDVRGFTTISEKYDAETLTYVLNRLLTPLTDAILERQGTVDKYMGDCIMAFWNAPLDDPDHAQHAVEAAEEMNHRMIALNEEMAAEFAAKNQEYIPLRIGIGINSGDVVVGNMGSDQRFDYSVLGDNVNLASRLEGQCKTYVVDTVMGEATAEALKDMALLELDLIQVKGRNEAVRIFTMLGGTGKIDLPAYEALRADHDKMIAAYRSRQWDEAESLLNKCRGEMNGFKMDGFYDMFAQRIHDYRVALPYEGWEGVFVAETK